MLFKLSRPHHYDAHTPVILYYPLASECQRRRRYVVVNLTTTVASCIGDSNTEKNGPKRTKKERKYHRLSCSERSQISDLDAKPTGSSGFKDPEVRKYGIGRLAQAPDSDLLVYLLQPVHALKYGNISLLSSELDIKSSGSTSSMLTAT
uniref:PIK helical domain-containing protein n=1 Tax=Glossina brevipalpis TaxID=37001 RepID=A0A1A9W035_9MUSC